MFCLCALSGSVVILFPAPHEAILWVDDRADVAEAALGEDARGGVWFWQRVGANGANVLGEGEIGERLGRLGRVAVSLMLGLDRVGDLHDAICRRSFEAALADGVACIAVQHGETV